VSEASPAGSQEAVAAYKQILRDCIDRRPSGTRQKIALALGKHKSFVSQITNPAYPAPVPARHLGTIFDLCHFSPEERAAFMAAYGAAHPRRRQALAPAAPGPHEHVIQIRVPALTDPRLQRELEETIRQMANRIIALVTRQ
jgi:HEAT repeat protein